MTIPSEAVKERVPHSFFFLFLSATASHFVRSTPSIRLKSSKGVTVTCASGEWHQLERYAMAPDRIWMGSVLHSTRLQVHYLLPLWLEFGSYPRRKPKGEAVYQFSLSRKGISKVERLVNPAKLDLESTHLKKWSFLLVEGEVL